MTRVAILHEPKTFSQQFGLAPDALSGIGCFEPLLNVDTPLYVDPRLLKGSNTPEMNAAAETFISFFHQLGTALSGCRREGDWPWFEAKRLASFGERNETHLGVAAAGAGGKGWGLELTDKFLRSLLLLIRKGLVDYDTAWCLPWSMKDIGPDRISDMTTNIILRELAAYTSRVAHELGVPVRECKVGRHTAQAPHHNERPILLVPTDVLGRIPLIDACGRAVDENEKLRQAVGAVAGRAALQGASWWCDLTTGVVEEGKPSALLSLQAVLQAAPATYDLDRDEDGLIAWRIGLGSTALVRDAASAGDAVDAILEAFAETAVNGRLDRALFCDHDLRGVDALRLLFFAFATAHARGREMTVLHDTTRKLTLFTAAGKEVAAVDVLPGTYPNIAQRFESLTHNEGRCVVLLLSLPHQKADIRLTTLANGLRGEGRRVPGVVPVTLRDADLLRAFPRRRRRR